MQVEVAWLVLEGGNGFKQKRQNQTTQMNRKQEKSLEKAVDSRHTEDRPTVAL